MWNSLVQAPSAVQMPLQALFLRCVAVISWTHFGGFSSDLLCVELFLLCWIAYTKACRLPSELWLGYTTQQSIVFLCKVSVTLRDHCTENVVIITVTINDQHNAAR